MHFSLITATQSCSFDSFSSPVYYDTLGGNYTSNEMPDTKWVKVGYSSFIHIWSFYFKFTMKFPVNCLFYLNSKFFTIAPSSTLINTLFPSSFLQNVFIELLSMFGDIFYTIWLGYGSILCLNKLMPPYSFAYTNSIVFGVLNAKLYDSMFYSRVNRTELEAKFSCNLINTKEPWCFRCVLFSNGLTFLLNPAT